MFSSVTDLLNYCDQVCWYYLNTQWHTPFWDAVIPFFRNQWFWLPVYFFLLLYTTQTYGRKGWLWFAFFLIAFAVSDQISATLLKPLFHRARPCNQKDLENFIHLLVPCGGGYSFPSSHASNHFSIGVFIAVTLSQHRKWVAWAAIFWAFLVAYSQVYVGVHFPFDVLGGGMLGAGIGLGIGKLFLRWVELEKREKQSVPDTFVTH
jgi:membrane-associated phospholipid phosphatase